MNQRNWKRVFFCTHSFRILSKFLSESVHVALKNEKGKNEITCVERLSSITFEKTLTKSVEKKKQLFFSGKKAGFVSKFFVNVFSKRIDDDRSAHI